MQIKEKTAGYKTVYEAFDVAWEFYELIFIT